MKNFLLPPIWLIVSIAGVGRISETVYSPALPTIATFLGVNAGWVEYTVTIYLFSFGLGTLFWGRLSDYIGRKTCILIGLGVYILASLGCYFSDSIALLMISRFVQGFGGSIGSVLAQAICRDAFSGPALGKAYAAILGSMAVFPAIGPIIGGVITQRFSWQMIFIFLIIFSGLIFIATLKRLPETLNTDQTELPKLWDIFIKLAKDKNVIGFGLLVSICNGIVFSYFGEGAFFIIELLDVSPSIFGMTFLLMATATVIGSIVSAKMQNRIEGLKIIKYGIRLILGSNILFSIAVLAKNLLGLSNMKLFAVTVVMMMGNMVGVCIVTSNSLAMSLQKYRYAIGTASSLFGFFYYICISLWSFGMGMLHNATLLPMPLYFLGLSGLMLLIFKTLNENRAS